MVNLRNTFSYFPARGDGGKAINIPLISALVAAQRSKALRQMESLQGGGICSLSLIGANQSTGIVSDYYKAS